MKVEQSQVTKLVITDVARHDPIHVYLEDYGDKRGRVTVTECSDSWSCFWGSMGCSLIKFILEISNQYWIGKLTSNLNQTLDGDNDANIKFAKNKVIKLLKEEEINKYQARDYWDLIESSGDVKRDCCDCYMGSVLLDLFGDNAYYENWPDVENPEYIRMASRLNTVREAIKQIQEG